MSVYRDMLEAKIEPSVVSSLPERLYLLEDLSPLKIAGKQCSASYATSLDRPNELLNFNKHVKFQS